MCSFVCICFFVFVCVSDFQFVCVCVCLFVCVSVSVCLSYLLVCVSTHQFCDQLAVSRCDQDKDTEHNNINTQGGKGLAKTIQSFKDSKLYIFWKIKFYYLSVVITFIL